MIRAYYRLTKPGIVYGNLFTAIAGYLFASQLRIDLVVLAALMAGMGLVIASACVFNNVIDRDIDAKMARTKDRATVTGVISKTRALSYGAVLGLLGVLALALYTNLLTTLVAIGGFIAYVFLYTYSKRVTRTHTLIGSISGAVAMLAGYTAHTNEINTAAIILFLSMVLWQMPHFYAIALYRLDEYKAAGIPLLPLEKGAHLTKIVIAVYIAAFIGAQSSLTVLGYMGYTYLAVVLGFGIPWFVRAIRGFWAGDDVAWAKGLFFYSLNVLLAYCAALSFGTLFV
jgi:heme o synthase